jgi:carbon storage regulator CsrA
MLVFSRKRGESIVIGDDITITILEIRGDKVRIAINSPKEVPIHREEVWLAIQASAPAAPRAHSPEELAFLQAVLESPDDEGIRLIFADWLQDRDDPRGEFIRIQCQLANLPAHDEQRADLAVRERELWAEYGHHWRSYLPVVLRSSPFKRGFVESIEMTVRDFLARAAEIFAVAPIRRLRVLPGWAAPETVAILPSLTGSPYLARLAEIDLAGLGLTDAHAAMLAGSPQVKGLRVLGLARNHIGSDGALSLAMSPYFADDLRLDLSGNPLGEAGMSMLRDRFGSRVRI